MERFKMHLGANIAPAYLCSLSDEELLAELEDTWDVDLLRDLAWRASLIDAEIDDKYFDEADFEDIYNRCSALLLAQ